MTEEAQRRTKRRYAHELYPHGDEFEVRPLEVDVPYLYARAIGFDVWGTGWFKAEPELRGARTGSLLDARHIALMADAMHQGLTGQEAWEWIETRMTDESGELIGERAMHYGIEADKIKPYPCGPRTRPPRPHRPSRRPRMADRHPRRWQGKRMPGLHRTRGGLEVKERIAAAIRLLYPDEMTPTARNVLLSILQEDTKDES